MAKAFINDTNLTDIADAIRATLDESRQYLPSEMAGAIQSIPIMAQLNRKKYFRPVPAGAASGYATIEQIEGNTVVWNQQFVNPNFTQNSDWGIYQATINSVADNILTFTSTTVSGQINQRINYIAGHKYYVSIDAQSASTANFRLSICATYQDAKPLSSEWQKWESIGEAANDGEYFSSFNVRSANVTVRVRNARHIDLTLIFGSGNEPTTVEEFETWREQIGLPSWTDYNAGELLNVKMSGMQTQDSSQQTLDTIALDVTTITGINTATNVREVVFPNGMKQADREGTVKDILDLLSDTATVNVGSRAYQSGDENDTAVITDGTTTYYAQTTPITYTDLQDANGNPLNPRYKVEQGGTEQVLPVNTSTPTTVAPTLTTTYTKDVH